MQQPEYIDQRCINRRCIFDNADYVLVKCPGLSASSRCWTNALIRIILKDFSVSSISIDKSYVFGCSLSLCLIFIVRRLIGRKVDPASLYSVDFRLFWYYLSIMTLESFVVFGLSIRRQASIAVLDRLGR
jgi:hypothetical protein